MTVSEAEAVKTFELDVTALPWTPAQLQRKELIEFGEIKIIAKLLQRR